MRRLWLHGELSKSSGLKAVLPGSIRTFSYSREEQQRPDQIEELRRGEERPERDAGRNSFSR